MGKPTGTDESNEQGPAAAGHHLLPSTVYSLLVPRVWSESPTIVPFMNTTTTSVPLFWHAQAYFVIKKRFNGFTWDKSLLTVSNAFRFLFCFWNRVSLCTPVWAWVPGFSATSQVLGLQGHGIMPAQPALNIFVYEISPDPRIIKRPYYHLVIVPKCNATYWDLVLIVTNIYVQKLQWYRDPNDLCAEITKERWDKKHEPQEDNAEAWKTTITCPSVTIKDRTKLGGGGPHL